MDFLFVLIELFSLSVTAEGLRTNLGGSIVSAKFSRRRGRTPTNIFNHFALIDKPVNALQFCR